MTPDLLFNFAVAVVGGSIGAMLTYYFRRRGRVYGVISDWKLHYERDEQDDEGNYLPVKTNEDIHRTSFSFRLDAFNEKTINTGLRGLVFQVYKDKELMLVAPLFTSAEAAETARDTKTGPEAAAVLNLPAGQWNSVMLYGAMREGLESQRFAGTNRHEFVAYFPDGKKFVSPVRLDRAWWPYWESRHANPSLPKRIAGTSVTLDATSPTAAGSIGGLV